MFQKTAIVPFVEEFCSFSFKNCRLWLWYWARQELLYWHTWMESRKPAPWPGWSFLRPPQPALPFTRFSSKKSLGKWHSVKWPFFSPWLALPVWFCCGQFSLHSIFLALVRTKSQVGKNMDTRIMIWYLILLETIPWSTLPWPTLIAALFLSLGKCLQIPKESSLIKILYFFLVV